jgi:gliding motility-associated-like protein
MFPTPASAGPDQILCPNSTVLAGNLPSVGIGTWSVTEGAGSIATPTSNTSNVSSLSTGTNSLVWTTTNGDCPVSSDTVLIVVLPPVQQAFAGNDTTIYVTSLHVNGNLPVSGTGVWQFVGGSYSINSPNQSTTLLTNLVPGVNTIKWTITEMCGSTSDEININLVVLQIPNAISPNGDGINDYLEIPISDYYKQVEVKIVNRWGNIEFEDNDYKNTWNGVNRDNQPLAEDTYFYVIKLDGRVQTGYILIKR